MVADGPRAVVLDTRAVTDVDDEWARDLSETLAAFPSGLGGSAAIVKPTDRDSALRPTRALDGVVPVFATRAGALLRAVIASGAAR